LANIRLDWDGMKRNTAREASELAFERAREQCITRAYMHDDWRSGIEHSMSVELTFAMGMRAYLWLRMQKKVAVAIKMAKLACL
jgi:hypothetical protein